MNKQTSLKFAEDVKTHGIAELRDACIATDQKLMLCSWETESLEALQAAFDEMNKASGLKSELREVENEPTFILGNAAQVETLIRNLLDNAIKFTPAGGQVNVKLSSSDEGVQLNVSDTGIGIPEDDLSHLFSRFHRGRNASPYPGSGLGLAIVKAITDQHQATIDVERKSPGTEFVVRFIPYRSSWVE